MWIVWIPVFATAIAVVWLAPAPYELLALGIAVAVVLGLLAFQLRGAGNSEVVVEGFPELGSG